MQISLLSGLSVFHTKRRCRKSISNLGLRRRSCGYRFKRIRKIIRTKLFDVNYVRHEGVLPSCLRMLDAKRRACLFLELFKNLINWLKLHLPFLKWILISKSNKHSIACNTCERRRGQHRFIPSTLRTRVLS